MPNFILNKTILTNKECNKLDCDLTKIGNGVCNANCLIQGCLIETTEIYKDCVHWLDCLNSMDMFKNSKDTCVEHFQNGKCNNANCNQLKCFYDGFDCKYQR